MTDLLTILLPPSSNSRVTTLGFVADRRRTIDRQVQKNGRCFTAHAPVFGKTVVVTEPALAKQIFTTSPDVRRIRRTQEELAEGKRRPCCWPGCTHRERTGKP